MSPAAYGMAIVLGLLWGSFANVCIYRWPAGASVVAPGSRCGACLTPIPWYDNVPVLAWLWLRGRCRACGATFSPRYMLVEAVTAALFGVAWWASVVAPQLFEPFDRRLLHFAIYAAFCFVMVVITFIDLDHKLILNKITVPSIAIFYLAAFAWPEQRWYDGVVGAAVGYGLPWAIRGIYYLITRREGMGLGDAMLLAVIGALLGWRGVVVSLFGGSTIGAIVGITALIAGRSRRGRVWRGRIRRGVVWLGRGRRGARRRGRRGGGRRRRQGRHRRVIGRQALPRPAVERTSVMRAELPFGPFLAIAAVLYLFAAPWIEIHFHLPGG